VGARLASRLQLRRRQCDRLNLVTSQQKASPDRTKGFHGQDPAPRPAPQAALPALSRVRFTES
jgi:hypothetical protein